MPSTRKRSSTPTTASQRAAAPRPESGATPKTRRNGDASKRSTRTKGRAAPAGPVRIEDLRRIIVVSGASFDPASQRIAFVRRCCCVGNETSTDIYLVDAHDSAASAEPRQITRSHKDTQPHFSPDGRQLGFVSKRTGSMQVHVAPLDGGEPRQLTHLPEGAIRAWRWSPDGSTLALSFRETEKGFRKEDQQKRNGSACEPPRIIDDLWYRLDGDGYFGAQRFKLLIVDAQTGEHRVLHEADRLGMFDFDYSPDGSRIALTVNRHRKALLEPKHTGIDVVDVRTGKAHAVPNLIQGPKSSVRFSPDGKRLIFAGREGEDGMYSTENAELFICDAEKGGAKSLTAGADLCLMAISVGDTGDPEFKPWAMFSPDGKRVLFRVGLHGATQLASVRASGGDLVFHTAHEAEHDVIDVGGVGAGLVAMIRSTPVRPTELVVLDVAAAPRLSLDDAIASASSPRSHAKAAKRAAARAADDVMRELTAFNAAYERETVRVMPESRWIEAADGTPVHVRVLMPPETGAKRKTTNNRSNGSTRTKKHPAALLIHGGPHAQYGSGFFHEFQVLAGAGFVVVFANPRGSKGYGRDFCNAIRGDWGGKDWEDVQAVIEFMQQHPAIDTNRMAVMGGSYGGYMTNHVIGHTDAFAAAVTDRCVSNLVSHLGNSDYYHKPGRYFPGNFWDDIDAAWRQSPIRHLGRCTTPTLVIHSEGDLRCNVEQGEQVFAVLQLRGVPSRMVRYPRSTFHGMSRNGPVELREHRLRQILEWSQTYTSRRRRR